jgi:hypothetical protein
MWDRALDFIDLVRWCVTPDLVNGLFEFVGSIFTWMNVRRVVQDGGYAGVYVPAIVFFMSWGAWNLYYYPSLGQWWSFHGGLSLVIANVAWIGTMARFGKK